MRTFLKFSFCLIFAVFSAVLAYAGNGYYDGSKDAIALKKRASGLISQNRGSAVLGSERVSILLQVQDPLFYHHQGVDLKTAGTGLTTITQSLSKRLAFNDFKPGIGKIRQTAYAMGLNKYLSKEEVLTLFIDTVPMGHSDDGWTVGLFNASQSFFKKPVNELNREEFIELISVMIAPSDLSPMTKGKNFEERVSRINRLVDGQCRPLGNRDVWFEGCKLLPAVGA